MDYGQPLGAAVIFMYALAIQRFYANALKEVGEQRTFYMGKLKKDFKHNLIEKLEKWIK